MMKESTVAVPTAYVAGTPLFDAGFTGVLHVVAATAVTDSITVSIDGVTDGFVLTTAKPWFTTSRNTYRKVWAKCASAINLCITIES
jgi:hypothetical protein